MYSFAELNRIVDLKILCERLTGTELKRHSNQWEGSCPFCGGNDRFYISDAMPNKWFCRHCKPSGGSAIDFVSGFYHLPTSGTGLKETADKLAELMNVTETDAEYKTQHKAKQVQMMKTLPEFPCQEWQTAVKGAVQLARSVLWKPEYRDKLDWLRNRGFTDDTLKKYCIGYYPTAYTLPIQINGVDVMACSGYYIPTFMRISDDEDSNVLTRVKIRMEDKYYKYAMARYEADPDHNRKPDKYLSIKGSKGVTLFGNQFVRPVNAGSYPNIIFVEGEFDAMSINQCAGDICKAVTFGSYANVGLAETWVRWYAELENVVICFDNETDAEKQDAVRKHEEKLRNEIIKAQSIIPEEYRGNAPRIRHLDDKYHDWNDILRLPNGAEIIRDKLIEWFEV